MKSCPNCESIWGIEEMDWNECFACGWPNVSPDWDSDGDDDSDEEGEEEYPDPESIVTPEQQRDRMIEYQKLK